MNFKNAMLYTADFRFHEGGFSVENGKFCDVLSRRDDAEDLNGAYVIPGLIDIHTHGNSNADFSDGDLESDVKMARYLAANGITSFAATTLTLPYAALDKAFCAAAQLREASPKGAARVMGINMEGPFFSPKKKGAQNADYLRLPDFDEFKKLYDNCGGLIRIVDIAPELSRATEFIEKASKLCTVSIAHTESDYEHAKAAIAAGATHLTHLFNAMPPIHHRNPGVIPAAAESEKVRAEIICDGIHVHPAAIRLAFRLFGAERMCIISDALRCCGMPNGEYMLGGQMVYLRDNVARLADGTIAGSATNLFCCMKRAIAFGIAPEDAIRAATYNPACALGAEALVGSIAEGKLADFVVCDEDFRIQSVYLGGEPIFRAQ